MAKRRKKNPELDALPAQLASFVKMYKQASRSVQTMYMLMPEMKVLKPGVRNVIDSHLEAALKKLDFVGNRLKDPGSYKR